MAVVDEPPQVMIPLNSGLSLSSARKSLPSQSSSVFDASQISVAPGFTSAAPSSQSVC